MIVQIKVRDDNGKYHNAGAFDFAMAALREIDSMGEGWPWLRNCLCRFCILQAENSASNHQRADLWYKRYQTLRDIA